VVVLDELARIGMLKKESGWSAERYRLTARAIPYFFAESQHGNNPEALPYLCYSTIVPQRIVWTEAVRTERIGVVPRDAHVFEAAFEWTASPIAAWANDAVLRAHSVVLSPTRSPSVATFVQDGRNWNLAKLGPSEPPLGRIVDLSVWPHPFARARH
jgi:hypothetical protein